MIANQIASETDESRILASGRREALPSQAPQGTSMVALGRARLPLMPFWLPLDGALKNSTTVLRP